MKARIPKQNKPEGIKASEDSKNFIIELGKPMTQIDEKLESLYEEMLNKYGETRRLDILEYMGKPEFINLFSPATPPIRKRVKEGVLKLGETYITGILEKTMRDLQKNHNISLEMIVEKMQTEEFKLRLKKMIPHDLSGIVEHIKNNYLERLIEERDFSRTVSKYTNDFDFLEQDKFEYSVETGKNSSSKFKNLEEYTRFTNLQSRVRQEKLKLRTDELGAIKELLNESEELGEAELNILLSRGSLLLIPNLQSRVKQRMGQLRLDELATIKKMLKESNDSSELNALEKAEIKILKEREKELTNPIDPSVGGSSEQGIRLKCKYYKKQN